MTELYSHDCLFYITLVLVLRFIFSVKLIKGKTKKLSFNFRCKIYSLRNFVWKKLINLATHTVFHLKAKLKHKEEKEFQNMNLLYIINLLVDLSNFFFSSLYCCWNVKIESTIKAFFPRFIRYIYAWLNITQVKKSFWLTSFLSYLI